MDIADLQRQAMAAREYAVAIGPPDPVEAARSIRMRVPTEHEIKLAALRAGVDRLTDAAAPAVLERALLVQAIIGWSNLQCADVLPADGLPGAEHAPAPTEPLAFAPAAVSLLLDAQPAWADTLQRGLYARLKQRAAQRESAAKN